MQKKKTAYVSPNIAGILSLFDPALDWSADLSGDEYATALKEFLVVHQEGSKDPRKDDDIETDVLEGIREEFLKVMLLDFLTGNEDRHTGNYLVTEDRKLVAIDNGFAGHASSWRGHQKGKSVDLLEKDSNDDYIFIERVEGNMAFPYMMAKEMRDKVGVTGILDIADRGSLAKEVSNMFDKYINPSNKKVVNKALKMSMWQLKFGKNSEQDYNALKNSFVEHASWNLQSGIIGNATGFLDVPYADDAMKQTMQELLDTDPYGGSKQNPQQKVDQMLSEYGEEDTPLPAAPGQVRDSERAAALQRAMEEANLDFEDLSSEALELEALRDLDYLD